MKTPLTGKRKNKSAIAATEAKAAWGVGAEIVRRCLLGLVTALVVARPLVVGEDPGLLLKQYSDPATLVLTFLWLVAAAAWALWRALTGQRAWQAGAVEGGLLAVVGLAFMSARLAAAYKHPAWLIAWEWLGILVAFCLVRQMFRNGIEGQRLLAAILATGISISAYAIYQYAYEMPEMRRALAERQPGQLDDEGAAEQLRKRAEMDHVFGTFAHPNTFAGYLALLLPAAIGYPLVSKRLGRSPWMTGALAATALVMALALWLTHSRGAILGTFLVALAFAAIRLRHHLWERKWLIGVAALILVVGGYLALQAMQSSAGVEKSQRSLGLRRDYWTATWKMISDTQHPLVLWLGVGPGNFGRYYSRYMLPTAFEDVKDPHNFALEMWATTGILSLIALLMALGAFFRAVWPAVRDPVPAPFSDREQATPWEFYFGGMAGLLLAYILWASGQTGEHRADAILVGGVVAAFRSVVWFVAFALMERVAWTGGLVTVALAAGLAALLLNLSVSGGIAVPSLAVLLWVTAALALNALPIQPPERTARFWITGMAAPPLLACMAFGYLVTILLPAADSWGYLQAAREYYIPYREFMRAGAQKKAPLGDSEFGKARYFVEKRIVPDLEKAAFADPHDAAPHAELAHWYEQLWVFSRSDEHRKKALQEADRAVALDPEGKDGYLARFELNLLAAQQPERDARDFYRKAAADLTQVVKRDPMRAPLRYRLAEVQFQAGDAVEGRRQAKEALDLDALGSEPSRKLTDQQRQQAQKWLAGGGGW